MRLLRLTSSDDFLPAPPEALSHAIASRRFTEITGEPVDVTLKRFWPTPGFDAALPRWLDEVDPGFVFFIVPSYPVCYESVPLRMERRLGRAGRFLNSGAQHTASSWIGRTAAFHAGRRLANRTIGGDPLVTVPEYMGYVGRAVRAILAREGVILVMRGPRTPFGVETAAAKIRSESRRQHLNRELTALCERSHIPLRIYQEPPVPAEDLAFVLADRVHLNDAERLRCGLDEGELMASAWHAAHRDA